MDAGVAGSALQAGFCFILEQKNSNHQFAQLHVCGEERMLPMLQFIAAACGDELEVMHGCVSV
jgi:hypothetical protein